ncbi:MAG: Holliday junction branch migration DNA helicase RuvB [Candidatus Latescibacteria bacterium]|nr:Holliday junction branch migration DNA helicase RuvB [bacterium]MBD3423946.1 Holliday junction branch migration DNA helicase RuvB [Candidatus Latescibacterota bacterium]
MERPITGTEAAPEEARAESLLRPRTLSEFVGQDRLKENLRVYIEAARQRGEQLDHVLLHGPPGLGKTTLAHIIARELGSNINVASGPVFQSPAELLSILTQLEERDVVFIDEIHRLNKVVEEHLYPAMEEFRCELIVDKGPHARHYSLNIEPFTIVGATTRAGMLTPPMRSRFGVVARLEFYSTDDIMSIVLRSAGVLGVDIDREGAVEIAKRSRGTPRIANRILRRVRDFSQVEGSGAIDRQIVEYSLERLNIDGLGLDEMDRRILRVIAEQFCGGPAGIKSIAVAVSEEEETIEDVYEPFLIQKGFIQRTARGRKITAGGLKHIGMDPARFAEGQKDFFE